MFSQFVLHKYTPDISYHTIVGHKKPKKQPAKRIRHLFTCKLPGNNSIKPEQSLSKP